MMKISNSKKELARIISEHGGWRNGEFAAQDGDDCAVWFYDNAPVRGSGAWWVPSGSGLGHRVIEDVAKLPNWHQTVLSRAEYFHLYPAPDVDATDKLSSEAVSAAKIALMSDSIEELVRKPTIEQLAADYRNKLDCANRKQDEADKANMESDAALAQLEDAIAEIGFAITPLAATEKEPELSITNWRDLRVGDVIWIGDREGNKDFKGECTILELDIDDDECPFGVIDCNGNDTLWPSIRTREWRFICRP